MAKSSLISAIEFVVFSTIIVLGWYFIMVPWMAERMSSLLLSNPELHIVILVVIWLVPAILVVALLIDVSAEAAVSRISEKLKPEIDDVRRELRKLTGQVKCVEDRVLEQNRQLEKVRKSIQKKPNDLFRL